MPAEGELKGSFAWATSTVISPRDEVRFVRAPGAEVVFVNGEGFIGDAERRGDLGVPVHLRKGENVIHVGGIRSGFELELWKPMRRLVIASWALDFKELEAPWPSAWEVMFVPVFNASLKPAESILFFYGHAIPADGRLPKLDNWANGGHCAPLGLSRRRSHVFDVSKDGPETWETKDVLAPVSSYDVSGPLADHPAADQRLLPLCLDGTRPTYGGDERLLWPRASPTVLIYETTAAPETCAAALSVARFSQQNIWYRTGLLPEFVSDTWLASERGEWTRKNADLIVRFGALETDEPGVLVAHRDEKDSRFASIRGSDPAGLRLAYLIDPFFRDLPDGKGRWQVP